jgi:hypothetical protein
MDNMANNPRVTKKRRFDEGLGSCLAIVPTARSERVLAAVVRTWLERILPPMDLAKYLRFVKGVLRGILSRLFVYAEDL